MSVKEQELAKEHEHLSLEFQYEQELADEEKQKLHALDEAGEYSKLRRTANRDWVRALDNMLRKGMRTPGLSMYIPEKAQRLRALLPGEQRYVSTIDRLDGSQVSRMCRQGTDGKCCLEFPRLVVEGKIITPALHLVGDQVRMGSLPRCGCCWAWACE